MSRRLGGCPSLLLLQIRQTTSLIMDILNLLRGLGVEVDELLASWSTGSLLVVGSQAGKKSIGTSSDAIAVVNRSGLVRSVVFLVDTVKGLEEAAGDTVLLVKLDGTLDGLVADNVTVGKILGNNAASRLLLLSDLVAITLSLVFVVAAIVLVVAAGAGDFHLMGTKLGVVEEQSSLGCSFLLERYGRILSRLNCGDFEVGDLATEREEVSDLLLAGLRTDVLDVDGIGRHDG